MEMAALGLFLTEGGALVTGMLLARRFALRHLPACYLPARVRCREQRRDELCRVAAWPAAGLTVLGAVLLLFTVTAR